MEALNILKRKYFSLKSRMKFLKVVKDPANTTAIFEMNAALRKSLTPEVLEKMMDKAFADPVMQKAYEEKYWPHVPSFEELEQLPDGSFGKELANFIVRWNLDKDFYPAPKLGTRSDYLLSRYYQAHDSWHVLTGYTPALEDELALQAFGIGQYEQPISLVIISGGFLHLLNADPEKGAAALRLVAEGFQKGKSAKNFLTHPVLERLHEPLDQVRKDLNII